MLWKVSQVNLSLVMNRAYVLVSYGVGPTRLVFSKWLTIVPFPGLTLIDSDDNGNSVTIDLITSRYQRAEFLYLMDKEVYEIRVHVKWGRGLHPEVIDQTLDTFKALNWLRADTTDIESIRKLTAP